MPLRQTIFGDSNNPSFDDAALLRFLESGTEDSFRHLCDGMSPRLMRYFRVRGCDSSSAEELTQDVLFTIYRRASSVRDQALFRGWIYKVAKNALLQKWRKARTTPDCIHLDSLDGHLPECCSVPPGLDAGFSDIVSALGPEERELLTLRYVDGLEYNEIATALDIPVGTAKWRVFNCKMKLSVKFGSPAKRKLK